MDKAFLLSAKETSGFFGTYLALKADLVNMTEGGHPENIGAHWASDPDYGYSNLAALAQNSKDHADYGYPAGQAYAWEFGISDVVSVMPAQQVIAVAKVLTKVQKQLAKVEANGAPPLDFADFVVRIAGALGVEYFYVQDRPLVDGTYASGVYSVFGWSMAADWLRERDRDFIRRQGGVVEAVAS